MDDGMTPGFKCRSCGAVLGSEEASRDSRQYCLKCAVAIAEDHIPDRRRSSPARKLWMPAAWIYVRWAVIVACLVLVAVRLQGIKNVLQAEKPIRIGSYATDDVADECIRNLWRISGGMVPEDSMVCPASRQPYRAGRTGSDTAVSCPDPERHGVRMITVAGKKRIPEVKT